MSSKPIVGYKRMWAFVFMILALATNLLYFAYVMIPHLIASTVTASHYVQWLLFNFWLIIILAILFASKLLLITMAKVENKVSD